MTPSEWTALSAELALRWPQQSNLITESWIKIWYPDVEPYSVNEIREALKNHVDDDPSWLPNGGRLAKFAAHNKGLRSNTLEAIQLRKTDRLVIDQEHAWQNWEIHRANGLMLDPLPFPRPSQKELEEVYTTKELPSKEKKWP